MGHVPEWKPMPDVREEPLVCVLALPHLSKPRRLPALGSLSCKGATVIPTNLAGLLGGANEATDGKELCKY